MLLCNKFKMITAIKSSVLAFKNKDYVTSLYFLDRIREVDQDLYQYVKNKFTSIMPINNK